MATYFYYNTLNNKVSTTVTMNFCQRIGPASECRAFSVADQLGCKYRLPSTRSQTCMFYREDFGKLCDNVWAQKSISMPFPAIDSISDSQLSCTMCRKYDTCNLRKDEDKDVCDNTKMREEIRLTLEEKNK